MNNIIATLTETFFIILDRKISSNAYNKRKGSYIIELLLLSQFLISKYISTRVNLEKESELKNHQICRQSMQFCLKCCPNFHKNPRVIVE